ncbi:MAG TPA: glycosyltransferase [Saprospiraceae bacterium]|nr:glycosyltransferase [Saprospiraceae bacterium]
MILVLQLVFVFCLLLLVHSYVIYPLSLYALFQLGVRRGDKPPTPSKRPPFVSCITSVYNEEDWIQRKLETVLNSDYPKDRLALFIGSDASTDGSNDRIKSLQERDPRIRFYLYERRRGKTNVINDLLEEALRHQDKQEDHIILFTDANVLFTRNTVKNLVKPFSDPSIALVDSLMIQENLRSDGISMSENRYMSLETRLKIWEGEVWGMMMGAFGGCFAIRSTYVGKVPPGLIVDDFYISMMALQNGGVCKVATDAICYEGIPNQLHEEFKRKTRISTGNFQNLAIFYNCLFRPPRALAFAFFSHKVLRWIGPILILCLWLNAALLSAISWPEYGLWFLLLNVVIGGIPLIDLILAKLGFHVQIFRGVRYFFLMNLALLNGFIKYILGNQNSAWQPPKRS